MVHSKPGVKEGAQDERDTYMRFLPGHSGVGPLDGLGHFVLDNYSLFGYTLVNKFKHIY